VVYRRDGAGLVHEVWMLTEDEYARLAKASKGDASVLRAALEAIFGTR
jgi:hypothetical protein